MLNGEQVATPEYQDFLIKNPDYTVDEIRKSSMIPPGIPTYSLTGLLTHLLTPLLTYSPTHLLTHSPTYLLTHSSTIESGLVHDYIFDSKTAKWNNWLEGQPTFKIERDAKFNSIVVPTIDTIRNEWIIELLLCKGNHVMCTGDTGTGKSVTLKNKLLKGMPEKYREISLNFSAQTSANQTQDLIDAKLDKRRKGVLGPPMGMLLTHWLTHWLTHLLTHWLFTHHSLTCLLTHSLAYSLAYSLTHSLTYSLTHSLY